MSRHSVRRLTALKELTSSSRYLEVGVSQGHTFNHVDFPKKHAVDPNFRFETKDHERKGISFFQQTSDDYFTKVVDIPDFDLIFLDGLHAYEQTYRDFVNAILHSHEKTIFLIDDTRPSDIYSAMRNQNFAVTTRRTLTTSDSRDWHGDVFKILFLLKLFHVKYEYATVCEDNPQTIVWSKSLTSGQSREKNPKPFKTFKDMRYLRSCFENLGSIDYHWTMNECSDIFQVAKEDDLLTYLKKSISR